jgi:predicted DNA-binding transcriptional regulator AlpA
MSSRQYDEQNSLRTRRVLFFRDLKARKGIAFSRQHIYRKVKQRTFPAPFKLDGSTQNCWFEDEIDLYLEQCAGRTTETPSPIAREWPQPSIHPMLSSPGPTRTAPNVCTCSYP